MKRLSIVALFLLFLRYASHAQCHQKTDFRSDHKLGWLITDLNITGTQTIDSGTLTGIAGEFIGACIDPHSEELGERVRNSFENRGYLLAEVKNVTVRVLDQLGQPQPITAELQVAEGARVRVGEIRFTGNHLFNDEELRNVFPIKETAIFQRDKIATGLQKLRDLYSHKGFLDFYAIPGFDNMRGTRASLAIALNEGVQYHMGKLVVLAKQDQVEALGSRWELNEGQLFDSSYPEKFLDANRALLPTDMIVDRVQLVRDCPHATVEVRLLIDSIVVAGEPASNSVECEGKPEVPSSK